MTIQKKTSFTIVEVWSFLLSLSPQLREFVRVSLDSTLYRRIIVSSLSLSLVRHLFFCFPFSLTLAFFWFPSGCSSMSLLSVIGIA